MDPGVSLQLLEYDTRFEQYGSDYTFYDYNKPEELPLDLKNVFNVVVADPPYLVRSSPNIFISVFCYCQLLIVHAHHRIVETRNDSRDVELIEHSSQFQ